MYTPFTFIIIILETHLACWWCNTLCCNVVPDVFVHAHTCLNRQISFQKNKSKAIVPRVVCPSSIIISLLWRVPTGWGGYGEKGFRQSLRIPVLSASVRAMGRWWLKG